MHKQLPGGLILRSLSAGFASDQEQLPDLYAAINGDGANEHVKNGIRHWTRDLMYNHPTVTLDDMFVVVDPVKNDQVVSATLLIPQTWRYEDIPLAVGRPELVATIPEYRGRGLVRALFEVLHERSAALGHQLQVITGIGHFYRQFGYTMAVDLAYPHAVFSLAALPDNQPTFTLRPATVEDIPDIERWNTYFARERLLTEAYSPDVLRYEITGRHWGFYPQTDYQVIVNAEGQGVGYIAMLSSLADPFMIRCIYYVVGDQSSYVATFDDVTRGIKQWALAKYGFCPAMLYFNAGIHDTLDTLIERSTGGHLRRNDYAWYIRVPDTIAFLQTIRPVLERRLEGSGAHRYTGELRIGSYDLTGIGLKFDAGQLIDVYALNGMDGYDISFPWNMFWNVLFGYQTCTELLAIAPDDEVSGRTLALMEILFPKKKSSVRGLA